MVVLDAWIATDDSLLDEYLAEAHNFICFYFFFFLKVYLFVYLGRGLLFNSISAPNECIYEADYLTFRFVFVQN